MIELAKTIFLETFGCQMNVLDSELITNQLTSLGHSFTNNRESADVILYNTCSVRASAEEKVYARIGDAKVTKQNNPNLILGIIGCMAEREGPPLTKRFPQLDIMCGPNLLAKLPALIQNAATSRKKQFALQGDTNRKNKSLQPPSDDLETLDLNRSFYSTKDNPRFSAFVRITRGCNKFCSYCVVPYTRGPEIHRPPSHILDECKRLADQGIIEITLLGQTVNHYHYDHNSTQLIAGIQQPQLSPSAAAFKNKPRQNITRKVTRFSDLLQQIHDTIPSIKRLRFVTSYARDFTDDILHVIAQSPRICNYLHLPAQSGSNRILKLMNRGYSVEQYNDLIDRARSFLPDVTLASDFIIGFPTETDEDFNQTLHLLHRSRFKSSFIFRYSPRPGTTAIDRLPDDIPEQTKRIRNTQLLEAQARSTQQVNESYIGKTLDVLVESLSPVALKKRTTSQPDNSTTTQLTARSAGDLIVIFQGNESLIGKIIPVKINSTKGLTLHATQM